VLAWRPLQYIGTISYGLYVWHFMLPQLVPAIPDEGGVLRLLAMGLGGLALASLSWHLVESPLNDLKRHFVYVPRPERAMATRATPAAVEAIG
jgi:peptidoglycan/LPS O-acetylase OafA/YrhL